MPRPKHYSKELKKNRQQIWDYKQQGFKAQQIQEIFKAKDIIILAKSISSVEAPYGNSLYREFKKAAGIRLDNALKKLPNLDRMIDDYVQEKNKQLFKVIGAEVKLLFGQNSDLRKLLPQERLNTDMRRIKTDIKSETLKQIIIYKKLKDQDVSRFQQQQAVFNQPFENLQQQSSFPLQQGQYNQAQGINLNQLIIDEQYYNNEQQQSDINAEQDEDQDNQDEQLPTISNELNQLHFSTKQQSNEHSNFEDQFYQIYSHQNQFSKQHLGLIQIQSPIRYVNQSNQNSENEENENSLRNYLNQINIEGMRDISPDQSISQLDEFGIQINP